MWKPYAVNVSQFVQKKFLLINFWTFFSEKHQFFGNFDKKLFLLIYLKVIHKKCFKTYSRLSCGQFLFIPFYCVTRVSPGLCSGFAYGFCLPLNPNNMRICLNFETHQNFLLQIQNPFNFQKGRLHQLRHSFKCSFVTWVPLLLRVFIFNSLQHRLKAIFIGQLFQNHSSGQASKCQVCASFLGTTPLLYEVQ